VSNASASRQPAPPQHAFGSWAIAIGTIAAAVAVGVFAIKHRAAEDNPTAAAAPAAATAAATPTATPEVRPHPIVKKTTAKAAKKPAGSVVIVVPPSPADTRSPEPSAKRAEAERPAAAATTTATASAETAAATPVTITGCLEASVSDDRFRLADTEGDNVPKARSWKTGFLKKRTAAVDLVGVNPRALEMHVGKKVSATGVLTSRELKVSSVHVVSPSCN